MKGRQSLFLALEFLGDPPFDGVLVSNGTLHLAHNQHGAAGWPEDVGALLIQEGLAIAVSRELHPGLSASGYLWTDDQHDSRVRQCSRSRRAVTSMVLEEITTSADEPNVRGLFAADSQARTLPSRSGYCWETDSPNGGSLLSLSKKSLNGTPRSSAPRPDGSSVPEHITVPIDAPTAAGRTRVSSVV